MARWVCERETVLTRQTNNWECGYVNCMALLNFARNNGADLQTKLECVAEIQRAIEAAWRRGFDPKSAQQFQSTLTNKAGRRAWIGPTEVAALLRHNRLDTVYYVIKGRRRAGRAVFDVAYDYFALSPPTGKKRRREGEMGSPRAPLVVESKRAPLFLQFDGHSQLVVGVDNREGDLLLIYDPHCAGGNLREGATIRATPCSQYDGKQFEMVGLGFAGAESVGWRELTAKEALSQLDPDMYVSAVWDGRRWQGSDPPLRF